MNKKDEEILANLEADIKVLNKELNETVKAIVDGEFSQYPILLAHSEEIAIAQKVIEKEVYTTHFNFSASTLEEMVARKIILEEKKSEFEGKMKDNADSFCVLLVHPESMKFIFTPKK